jgi:DNA-binding NtrC family response regulator
VNVLPLPNAYPDSLKRLAEPAYQAARVVFFDLVIGTVSGLDLGRALRENGDTRPFFLVTAANNPNPGLLDQLQITFLQKPLDFDQVAALVHSLA